jgi:hypothetical protein
MPDAIAIHKDVSSAAGGFLPPKPSGLILSPADNSVSSPSRSSLPHPRSQPLKAGSNKEEITRRYVEDALLQISRRYVKKFQPEDMRGESETKGVKGYGKMGEVCRDLGEVVDVLWRSGTRMNSSPPSLPFPYHFPSPFPQLHRSKRGADALCLSVTADPVST